MRLCRHTVLCELIGVAGQLDPEDAGCCPRIIYTWTTGGLRNPYNVKPLVFQKMVDVVCALQHSTHFL